jgi:hypothetical protein
MSNACVALFGLLDISLKDTAIRSRGHPREERVLFRTIRWQGLIEIVYDRVVEVYIYIDSGSSEIEY